MFSTWLHILIIIYHWFHLLLVNDYIYIFKLYHKAIYTTENTRNQSFLKHHIRKLNNLGTVFIFPMLAGLDSCAFWGRLMRPRVVSKMFKRPVFLGHWPFRRDSNKRAGGGPQDLLLTRPSPFICCIMGSSPRDRPKGGIVAEGDGRVFQGRALVDILY